MVHLFPAVLPCCLIVAAVAARAAMRASVCFSSDTQEAGISIPTWTTKNNRQSQQIKLTSPMPAMSTLM